MRIPLRLLLTTVVVALVLGSTAISAFADTPNDNFAAAEALTGNRGMTYLDLSTATHEAGEPLAGDSGDITAWFKYSPTSTGFATFSTCRTESDLEFTGHSIGVFSGSALASLTNETTSTGGCKNGRVNVTTEPIAVSAGTDYFIQIEISATSEIIGGLLNYDFNTAVPANDDFADATALPATLPQTIDADSGLASIEPGEIDAEEWGPRQSLWYSWTPSQDGTVSIDNCTSDLSTETDSLIEIYGDFDPDPEALMLGYWAGNDDGCPAPNTLLSHAYLAVTSGETYFVRVSNYSDDFGAAYELHMKWVGAPETPRAPYIYPTADRVTVGDTINADAGSWFADPAITDVSVQWKLCDEAGDDCSDIDGATEDEYVLQPSDVGHTLRVAVTATNGVETVTQESEPGPLVDDVPTNDNFADALDLGSSSPTTVAGDNYYATSEDGENNAAATPVEHSVWYRWTAPQSKAYFVDGCSSAAAAYRFAVNVYDGSGAAVDELVRPSGASVGCGDDAPYARTYFRAEAGSTYFIQAGNVESRSALDFTLSIDEVPAPEFASLPTLTGDALEGSTLSLHSQPEDSVLTTDEEIFWNLCDTAGDNCTDLEDITTSDAELAAAMVGKRLRATVTYTNANGSISQSVLSDVVKADSDGDGVPDEDDDCPSDAQGSGKSNGCPLEEIDVVVDPSLSGTAQVGSAIALDLGSAVSSPGLDANVNPFVYTVDWLSCTSTTVIESCAARTGSSEAYTPTAGDVGRSIRAKVVWRNGDAVEETVYSAATVAVTAVPVTPPSAGGGGGGGNTQPPAATNPLILTVKKSLGSLTPKKGVITINGAVVSCGASATGPCTGTITFNVIKGKTSAKYIEYPIWVAPGKTSAVTVKLKSAKLKAIAKAKSVKTTVKISVAAPGFGPSIATATATLKPQKK